MRKAWPFEQCDYVSRESAHALRDRAAARVESCHFTLFYRDVAQLVARVLWEHDVAGSNPVIPTKKEKITPAVVFSFLLKALFYLELLWI